MWQLAIVVIIIVIICIYLLYPTSKIYDNMVGSIWISNDATKISFLPEHIIGITKKINLKPTTLFLRLTNVKQNDHHLTAMTPQGNIILKYDKETNVYDFKLNDTMGTIVRHEPYAPQTYLLKNRSFKSAPTPQVPTGTLTVNYRYGLYDINWKQGNQEASFQNTNVLADNYSIQFIKDNAVVVVLQKTDVANTYNSPIGIISLNIDVEATKPAHKQEMTPPN